MGWVAFDHDPALPVPLLQDVARDHPPGGDDVFAVPAVAAQRRGSAARAGIDISHETVRFWWPRFGPMFAAQIRKRRVEGMRSSRWRWDLDEVFVKINGEHHYLCRSPSIMKARCWNASSRRSGTGRLH